MFMFGVDDGAGGAGVVVSDDDGVGTGGAGVGMGSMSVWVQALVVELGFVLVWVSEFSKVRAGVKQCSPWPVAIHSKCSSAHPSSNPMAKSLIFAESPSSKPCLYPWLSASSSFLSRVWRIARF